MVDHVPLLSFEAVENGGSLAKAIVDTIHDPFLVLDQDLRVIAANRSFYLSFRASPQTTCGLMFYDLAEGQWDIPDLRRLLEKVVSERGVMDDFEVEKNFAGLGRRTMLLNARIVFCASDSRIRVLLALADITSRRATQRQLQELLAQKNTLLVEMSHRIANSLQIIAGILLMKAKTVDSAETRLHLEDAHRRVMSVASVQNHLQASENGGEINIGSYLSKLCEALTISMIGESRPITLKVVADEGTADAAQVVCFGLIVTELVMNALKHAFSDATTDKRVIVGYETKGQDWRLSVSDNGAGMSEKWPGDRKPGLGTGLIAALAQQLEAKLETTSGPTGTTVSITRATFTSLLPTIA